MMQSSSISSVNRELMEASGSDERTVVPTETSHPEIVPTTITQDRFAPFLTQSLPPNLASIPGAQDKPGGFSVSEFSAELQRELEAKGLRTPLISSEDSSQYLGSDEPTSGHFDRPAEKRSLTRVLKDCYRSYRGCSFAVSESMAIIILYVVLMFFSSHAAFMGFHYYGKCPWLADVPSMFATLGLCSLVALTCRTYYLIQKRYFPRIHIYIDRLLFTGSIVLFVIVFSMQCIMYYSKKDGPTIEGDASCGIYFYNYIRIANWLIPVVFVAMAILHGPTSFWLSTRHPCLERFEE